MLKECNEVKRADHKQGHCSEMCFCDISGKRKRMISRLHGEFFSEISIDSRFISRYLVYYHIFLFYESHPTSLRKQGKPRPLRDSTVSTLCYTNADFQEWTVFGCRFIYPWTVHDCQKLEMSQRIQLIIIQRLMVEIPIFLYRTLLFLSIFYKIPKLNCSRFGREQFEDVEIRMVVRTRKCF